MNSIQFCVFSYGHGLFRCVCVCQIFVISGKNEHILRIFVMVYRYYQVWRRTRSSWNDTSEEAPLTADTFRIGFQRKPENRRFKRSKRSTKSKLSIEFHWSVVDRNHSFECNQRCSQMRCQSGVKVTKVSCYFSFFPFFSSVLINIQSIHFLLFREKICYSILLLN